MSHVQICNFFQILPVIIATTVLPLALASVAPRVQADPVEGVDVPRLPKCKKGQTVGCTTM